MEKTCPSCHITWPEDRFNPKFPDCFRCRAAGVSFTYGVGGKEAKQQFHDTTIKEFNDRQIREAKANGIDAVPVHTATTAAPTGKMLDTLKRASEARIAPKVTS